MYKLYFKTEACSFLALVVCCVVSISPSYAQTLFFDAFEDSLSQWVGKGGGAYYGVIVEYPLRTGNHVLTFSGLNGMGDIFGTEVSVTLGQTYVLSFEYLGLPDLGGVSDNLGGFIGFSDETPGFHRWLAGTAMIGGAEDDPLIDDGQWRTYIIEFDPFVDPWGNLVTPTNNTIRVMVEDYFESGGVAGDALFDNIRLSVAGADTVSIDIKPESCPNPLNLNGRGVLAVAILGTGDFDVTQVDPTTVKLSREGVEEGVSPLRWAYEDVGTPFEGELCDCHNLGPDGYLDLTLKFKVQELVEDLELADVAGNTIPLVLTGNLKEEFGGTLIDGGDCVWILE